MNKFDTKNLDFQKYLKLRGIIYDRIQHFAKEVCEEHGLDYDNLVFRENIIPNIEHGLELWVGFSAKNKQGKEFGLADMVSLKQCIQKEV